MKENSSVIRCNEAVSADAWRLRFEVDWDAFDPGQFVMIGIPGNAVLLRRPFGIAGLSDGCAEVCYKVVGRGTEALTKAAVGTPLAVTGPCGRGFTLPSPKQQAVLVAGGYGIGPMMGLSEQLIAQKQQELRIYYGARTRGDLLYRPELEKIAATVVLTTDDGSEGTRGLVTAKLQQDLGTLKSPALFACGPEAMLRAVAKLALSRNIPAQVSTEAYMACGIGVCNGCVCRGRGGDYLRTCRDGPVFNVNELSWEG